MEPAKVQIPPNTPGRWKEMGGCSIAVLNAAVSWGGGGREGRWAPASSGRNMGAGGAAGYTAEKKKQMHLTEKD